MELGVIWKKSKLLVSCNNTDMHIWVFFLFVCLAVLLYKSYLRLSMF